METQFWDVHRILEAHQGKASIVSDVNLGEGTKTGLLSMIYRKFWSTQADNSRRNLSVVPVWEVIVDCLGIATKHSVIDGLTRWPG